MDTELNAYEPNTRYSYNIEYGLALLDKLHPID